MRKILKTDIKDNKPNIKLKPNHYHFISSAGRVWNSTQKGTAISDGRGWYKYR